jgi:hypothetical protein
MSSILVTTKNEDKLMKKIGQSWRIGIIGMVCLFGVRHAGAIEVVKGEDTLNVNGRIQHLSEIESIDDPYSDSERLFMFLKQARLSVNGEFKGADYNFMWMMGGEEVPERNSVMSLLDAYVNIPLPNGTCGIRFGQFKVPYSRERLLDSGDMLFSDRSIHNNYFNIGRDVGVAMHTKRDRFNGALGVFTGGGINIPERNIPEDLGVPMLSARLGVNSGLDEDVFTPSAGRIGDDSIQYSVFVNGVYTKDSRVGHSSPLNVKYYDKSYLLLETWNPYVDAEDEKAEFSQLGVDAAVQVPLCEKSALLMSAEYNISDFSNNAGSLDTKGGVASVSYLRNNWSVGVRVASVDPDEKMGYVKTDSTTKETTVYSITDKSITEITPNIVYYMPKYNLKIIADVDIQLDVPVSIEKGNGAYNLMKQPDQVTYASNGGIELQDAYLAKLLVQYEF